MSAGNIYIMKTFPDFNSIAFDLYEYNEQFRNNNVIIHASSCSVSYPEHWGCLSIKCAFHGNEYYQSGKRFYSVNENNFLVLNEGNFYSSYIFSKTPVESFTVNFSSEFEMQAIAGLTEAHENLMENRAPVKSKKIDFVEKLYSHDKLVSPVLFQLFSLSLRPHTNEILMKELYYTLIERLLSIQKQVYSEIQTIKAIKHSTKTELYKRLHYAKDFMDSCYTSNLTLESIAGIAHLNTAYFLRSFKSFFKVTPYQYLIQRRLTEAKKLLETSDMPINEVCMNIGYNDSSSFTKLFKNRVGVCPEAYQKDYKRRLFAAC